MTAISLEISAALPDIGTTVEEIIKSAHGNEEKGQGENKEPVVSQSPLTSMSSSLQVLPVEFLSCKSFRNRLFFSTRSHTNIRCDTVGSFGSAE